MRELTINKEDTLRNIDTNLIGNGGSSRLMIMLDPTSGEVWTDEYYSHEDNSWKEYSNRQIMEVGIAKNANLTDEEGNEYLDWNITIYDPE